jgi:hypothetical protein
MPKTILFAVAARFLGVLAISAIALFAASAAWIHPASADPSPAQLTKAGWTCFVPPPETNNPNAHCAPPGHFEAGVSPSWRLFAFQTGDVAATEANFQGTERLIRSDLYHGQPCPTDPSPDDPPTYLYSDVEPATGLDYHICHTFDSVW